MTTLYAYDFDRTMVPYDSFRYYLWHLMKLRPVRVGGLLVLRKMRILSSSELKEYVTRIVMRSEMLKKDAKRFANRIVYDVQMPKVAPKGGVVLIVSASPSVYMQHVAEELGCKLLCTSWEDGKYVEMYGETKREWLLRKYPKTEFTWSYAASDSSSDVCWMKEFNQYDIIAKQ